MQLIAIACLLGYSVAYATDLPLVTTPFGPVQGTYSTSYNNKVYAQFLGVPYAQPPIGELRFQEPRPIKKWEGIWNANISSACIQINHGPEPEGGNLMGEEDCLYLSIFVPKRNPSEKDNLDVIVHIHGGAFNFGYGNLYAGPKYLMDKNVILVTINYRLGPLGFLSTEDDVVPGNNGMKDQSMSLKWIKENIKYFGGNPESITITGLSAGGASVHYHYLSPLSKGLFNRGISVSGTALCPWTLQEAALSKAKRLGAAVGCVQESNVDLIKCLRQRPAQQIVESVRMFRPWLYNPFSPFGLVVEKGGKQPFLPEHPYVLLSKGKVQDLPLITSVTSEEGLYPAADFMVKDHFLADLERRWDELASSVLDYNYTLPLGMHKLIAQKTKDYYLKGQAISKDTFNELVQMMGDRLFVVPAEKTARLQAKVNKSPVYYYYFTYPGEEISTLAWYYTLSENKYGVCHGDDVMYILSIPNRPIKKMTKKDESMKDIFLQIWSSFSRTGTPEVQHTKWEPVSKSTKALKYLHINSPDKILMTETEDMGHNNFWNTIPFEENEYFLNHQKDEL